MHNISVQNVADNLKVSKQQIYYIERLGNNTALLNYFSYLRRKGVDLNKLFEEKFNIPNE
jgi:hypothetical protein